MVHVFLFLVCRVCRAYKWALLWLTLHQRHCTRETATETLQQGHTATVTHCNRDTLTRTLRSLNECAISWLILHQHRRYAATKTHCNIDTLQHRNTAQDHKHTQWRLGVYIHISNVTHTCAKSTHTRVMSFMWMRPGYGNERRVEKYIHAHALIHVLTHIFIWAYMYACVIAYKYICVWGRVARYIYMYI